jgi:proteasome lid subunit RPN8/RPN11
MTGTPPGGRPSELQGLHLQRVLPVAQSVLWHPTSPGVTARRAPSGAYPVFFDQKTVAAVHAHYETAGRQGMMGFLVGDLFECPTSRVRYVVIDSTIRLNQAVYGDKTLVIVSRLWDRIQEELRKTEGHLIGWYHSHPPIAVELAPGDVETHLQYFKRPWHVALVLGAEHEGPVAGLFRPRPGETATSMPFYELIESDEGFAGGKKRSILPWINFLSDDPAVLYADAHGAAAASAAPPAGGPSSTLQVVRPVAGQPRTGPQKSVTPPPQSAYPSGSVRAVPPAQPSGPVRAVPPAQPSGPMKAVPPVSPSGPVKAVPPGTVARPALGERLPPAPAPSAPSGPPKPPAPQAPMGPRARRDTQMKPPPNALSNLPLLAAGGYELGEVDARESNPDVMTPQHRETRPVPAPAPKRPTQTPRPFAPALAPRKSDGHPGLVAAIILLLLGGGGFAGWWFLLRQPTPTAPTTTAGTTTAAATTTATPADTTHAAAPPPVDSTLLRFERIADSVSLVVKNYDVRMRSFGASQADCGGLSQTLVAVEDAWTDYNVGKRKMAGLDPLHAARDQELYAAVDSVERAFDRSGCQRP